MNSAADMMVFDRTALRRHRNRMASRLPLHDFLHAEAAARLGERLADIKRDFRSVLLIGGAGFEDAILPRRPERLVLGDMAFRRLGEGAGNAAVFDEDALPFAEKSFDLVVSLLTLHWVNDLPGALVQATMLGAGTLDQLRIAWMKAELEVHGGASPRVSPFADVRSLGGLLQRAGFALPVVDNDTITATYADPVRLMREIRGMGEANALIGRARTFARRDALVRMAELYREEFGEADGRIPARFDLVTLTGWAPDASQPKPLKPGSARLSLAKVLGTPPENGG
jgi:NADH dehydrogenase [ubiquinone] 1 alpha subcomplex assembly factor 5